MTVDLRREAISGPATTTVAEAAKRWSAGVRTGAIRNRSGDVYKPSVVRSYNGALRLYVLPELGGRRLSELSRGDVQRFVDKLDEEGVTPSSVRNALMPLRAICRRAIVRGELAVNPTRGLELPAQRSKRDRVAPARECVALLAVVPDADRPIWATAMYAGLRLGELQALRWMDVDLARGVIHVRRSWDPYEGVIEPKSRAGVRVVPLLGRLREELADRKPLAAAASERLAFGRTATTAFSGPIVLNRGKRLWGEAGMKPIGLHECRHAFASLMIAAGVNVKALQVFMGHASITVTLDLYGYLLPGSEDEATRLADAYPAREEQSGNATLGEHLGNGCTPSGPLGPS